MKIDLTDAAFYGEWCSEEDSEYEVNAWFEKSSFGFFYTSNLINKFGYKNFEEIQNSGYFIPIRPIFSRMLNPSFPIKNIISIVLA